MSPAESPNGNPADDFGPNEWMVDEIYHQYLADRSAVDPAWWDFFADYKPSERSPAQAAATTSPLAAAPAAPAAPPAPAAAPQTPTTALPAPTATKPPAGKDAVAPPEPGQTEEVSILRGPAARVVANMSASLEVPTATSVRAIPAKLLIDNRIVINNHLKRRRGGKVSFTHLLGYAIVKALQTHPEMNCAFADLNGKPAVVHHDSVNFGLAIDLP